MTSLKNQQSLLKNPLDLSIDLTSSPGKLFNSYIELFVEYDFLTLLLNSAFVSIVTVIITLLFSIPGAYAVAKLRFPARQWFSGSSSSDLSDPSYHPCNSSLFCFQSAWSAQYLY